MIWTNEPVMGVATRLASIRKRKQGTKILYMTHGFHFYKGAPRKNWILFYPIERWASRFCDVIVTLNREDFSQAKKMHSPIVKYIHGIGINPDRLSEKKNQENIREELGLTSEDFICISVGELNENKNHRVVIKALGKLHDLNIHYILCGKGDQLKNLTTLAQEYELSDNVHFLGYRKDVLDICCQSDLFIFPSYREGLPISPLEAMYCGLPLITSNIRGPVDFMENGITGYLINPDDIDSLALKIKTMKMTPELCFKMGEHNKTAVHSFLLCNSKEEVLKIINELIPITSS